MGDGLDFTALAVPLFGLAVVGEAWWGRRRGLGNYAVGSAIADLSSGGVYQSIEVVLRLVTLAAYAWVYEHARVVTWDAGSPWPWIIGIVGLDFAYYWWHRTSHVVNSMWAVHAVHHHGEDYNLAVALRQPVLEPVTWLPFFAVLAVAGVPPIVYVASLLINLFYQFWLHTELVHRLPRPLELVLNTPSHHRVHHGVDPQYLDRNYGGMLIVWDRMFGSFEPEGERPHYGTSIPLRSYNPLASNVAHFRRIWQLCRLARRTRDRLWAWLAHPAWLPDGVEDPQAKPDRATYELYRPSVPVAVTRHAIAGLAVAVAATTALVLFAEQLAPIELAAGAAAIVASLVTLTGWLEDRQWARRLDGARIVALAAAVGWIVARHASPTLGATLAVACALVTALPRLGMLRGEGLESRPAGH